MLVCEHFRTFDLPTYISTAEHPWNAWIEVYDIKGKIYYSGFHTGLRFEYLKHLLTNPKCRREVKATKKQVLKMLKEIEREWQKAISQ